MRCLIWWSDSKSFLEELQNRPDEKGGPLVVKLPRAPGMREQRWAHLLCGPVATETFDAGGHALPSGGLEARVAALEQEVAGLRSAVRNIYEQLGMSQPGQTE